MNPNLDEIWQDDLNNVLKIIAVNKNSCKATNIKTNKTGFYLKNKLKPIKLSKEWLKKLNFYFEYNKEYAGWFSLPLLNENINMDKFILLNDEDYYIFVFDETFEWRIQYIHELQRLFLCLSNGRSLKLNAY